MFILAFLFLLIGARRAPLGPEGPSRGPKGPTGGPVPAAADVGTQPLPWPLILGPNGNPALKPLNRLAVCTSVRPCIGETHLTNGASGGLGFEALASRARRGQLNEPVGG